MARISREPLSSWNIGLHTALQVPPVPFERSVRMMQQLWNPEATLLKVV
jgi:hypothetical protein